MPESKANQHIAAMAPYAVADLSARRGVPLISLAQNESFRAPSPHAIVAGQRALETGALYPDPDYPELRAAIAAQHDVDEDVHLVFLEYPQVGHGLNRCWSSKQDLSSQRV